MNIRIVQMKILLNKEKNIKHALELVNLDSLEHIDIVIFPEMFSTGYQLEKLSELAHTKTDSFIQQFLTLAKQKQVHIVLGSLALKTELGITNTTLIIDNTGKIISEYSKIHLFGLMDEPSFMTAGKNIHSFEVNGTQSSSIVCYDLRFPELTRRLALKENVKIIFVPMEWPAPRTEVFKTLLKARAIENQCFVVSCNRVGKAEESNALFEGYSMAIDPYGNILADAGTEEKILDVKLDMKLVEKVRSHMNCFSDRREEFY
jgi:predicted amidohydrolase